MSRTHGDRSDPANKARALKKQVESLKRDNQQLQKELRKANQRIAELQNTVIEDADPHEVPRTKGGGSLCTNCRKGVYVLSTIPIRGGAEKSFLFCNLCKDRKPCK